MNNYSNISSKNFFKGAIIILALLGTVFLSHAQEVKPDTMALTEVKRVKKKWDPAKKAAIYSAILPGLGQIYNKKYWKLPILYGGAATLGYFLVWNQKNYIDFRNSYRVRTGADPNLPDKYPQILDPQRLKLAQDYYKRNRDLSIILSVVLYGLNIVDAAVDGHLKNFDVSDDLSLGVSPTLLYSQTNDTSLPGLSVRLTFK